MSGKKSSYALRKLLHNGRMPYESCFTTDAVVRREVKKIKRSKFFCSFKDGFTIKNYVIPFLKRK